MRTTSSSILTRNSPILLPDLGVGQIAFVEDGNCLYVGTYNGNAKILGESPDSSPINAHEAHYDHTLIHAPGSDNQDLSTIVAHVGSAHAPSNAQKNSDITKSEIEAVLTGELTSHSHAGGGGLSQAQVLARGLGA